MNIIKNKSLTGGRLLKRLNKWKILDKKDYQKGMMYRRVRKLKDL